MTLKTKLKKTVLPTALIGAGVYLYQLRHRTHKSALFGSLIAGALVGTAMMISTPAYAQMNEAMVMNYAQNMQKAANSHNINQIARLLSDDVIVSLTRQGRGTVTLDKAGYLDLLQKGWIQTSDYQYAINVEDIIITGDTARAQVITRESWTQNGKTTTLITTSRATLGVASGNALLLRSVSQVSTE